MPAVAQSMSQTPSGSWPRTATRRGRAGQGHAGAAERAPGQLRHGPPLLRQHPQLPGQDRRRRRGAAVVGAPPWAGVYVTGWAAAAPPTSCQSRNAAPAPMPLNTALPGSSGSSWYAYRSAPASSTNA